MFACVCVVCVCVCVRACVCVCVCLFVSLSLVGLSCLVWSCVVLCLYVCLGDSFALYIKRVECGPSHSKAGICEGGLCLLEVLCLLVLWFEKGSYLTAESVACLWH